MTDKGLDWQIAHYVSEDTPGVGGMLLEAMHDRDKFDREAAYWREQTEAMRESCGYAHLAPCWEAP